MQMTIKKRRHNVLQAAEKQKRTRVKHAINNQYNSISWLQEELLATAPAVCQATQSHAPCHDDNGQNLWNCKQTILIKSFLYKNCCNRGFSSQQWKLN